MEPTAIATIDESLHKQSNSTSFTLKLPIVNTNGLTPASNGVCPATKEGSSRISLGPVSTAEQLLSLAEKHRVSTDLSRVESSSDYSTLTYRCHHHYPVSVAEAGVNGASENSKEKRERCDFKLVVEIVDRDVVAPYHVYADGEHQHHPSLPSPPPANRPTLASVVNGSGAPTSNHHPSGSVSTVSGNTSTANGSKGKVVIVKEEVDGSSTASGSRVSISITGSELGGMDEGRCHSGDLGSVWGGGSTALWEQGRPKIACAIHVPGSTAGNW